MDRRELARETRKQRRLEMIGLNDPRCGMCGETGWQCIELHHVADYARDDMTVLICRNCHRKVSDDQRDHPAFNPSADPMLDAIGHFLLGLADMLRRIVEKLWTFGTALIELAAQTPTGAAR